MELKKLRKQMPLVAMQSGDMALRDLMHLMGKEAEEVDGWICAVQQDHCYEIDLLVRFLTWLLHLQLHWAQQSQLIHEQYP